jgi:hypothetical protein
MQMSLLKYLYNSVETAFQEHPHRFFTEHDIHSELALIVTTLLQKQEKLYVQTKDGFTVSRVHHEYPTPFRCDMKNDDFRVITEQEFNSRRQENQKRIARRGFIDFAVLNLDFISSNKLSTVSGKRYKDVLENLKYQQYPAVDLAVEVVYYPTFDEKPHVGIMKRRVASTIQDYKKLVALAKFMFPHDTPFCREAAMLFFSNTAYKAELNEMFKSFSEDKVPCFKILYPANR